MTKILKIGKALYAVDDKTKTYKYFGRNPDWKELGKEKRNKIKDMYMVIQVCSETAK